VAWLNETAPTGAPATPDTADVSFVIGGMTCGECAATIERRLNAAKRARIVPSSAVPMQALIAEVHAARYSAEPAGAATPDDSSEVEQPLGP
jgi:P-type Cu+ transporter